MTNGADQGQLASRSQLIWMYTVCISRTYSGSAGPGLTILKRLNHINAYKAYVYVSTSFVHAVVTLPKFPSG